MPALKKLCVYGGFAAPNAPPCGKVLLEPYSEAMTPYSCCVPLR